MKEDKDTKQITHVSKLTRQTVEKMVQEAFEFCDTNKDGKLSQPQFTAWVKQNPGALQLLETVFAKHIWSGWEDEEAQSPRFSGGTMFDPSEDSDDDLKSPKPGSLTSRDSVKHLPRGSNKSLTRLPIPATQLSPGTKGNHVSC